MGKNKQWDSLIKTSYGDEFEIEVDWDFMQEMDAVVRGDKPPLSDKGFPEFEGIEKRLNKPRIFLRITPDDPSTWFRIEEYGNLLEDEKDFLLINLDIDDALKLRDALNKFVENPVFPL